MLSMSAWTFRTRSSRYAGQSTSRVPAVSTRPSQLSKIMNYIQYTRSKIFTFFVLFLTWSYFRHWLNLVILYSVWTEFDLMPYVSQ